MGASQGQRGDGDVGCKKDGEDGQARNIYVCAVAKGPPAPSTTRRKASTGVARTRHRFPTSRVTETAWKAKGGNDVKSLIMLK